MSDFRRTANLLLIAVLCCVFCFGTAHADDYRFDDLDTNSGVGSQWMIVTGSGTSYGDTLGNPTSTSMDVSGDLASGRNPVYVLNGKVGDGVTSDYKAIQSMFIVLSGNGDSATATFPVDFGTPSGTPDTTFGEDISDIYSINKATLEGTPTEQDYYDNGYNWSQNIFTLVKSSAQSTYQSVRTNFIFNENPESTPSQTLVVPMVVANVAQYSTAKYVPLVFRTLLRDNQNTKDIVAYDHFTWDVQSGTAPQGGTQWVFVPVDKLPVDESTKINYQLVSQIANHTSRRYAVQRYDNYSVYTPIYPNYWNFDMPYTTDNNDIARRFTLDELSHIAPGLSTVYTQTYNVRQADKIPYRIYQVDPAGEYYNLGLNHKIIFGQNLGSAVKTGSSKYNSFEVTAFYFTPANPDFLKTVASKMNSTAVNVPTTKSFLTNSAISYEEVTADSVGSYTISRVIPTSLTSDGSDGLLPLHITFNIPRSVLQLQGTDYWDTMLKEWYSNGDIHELFANYFSVYMLSRETGTNDNHWNLIQQLQTNGVYNDLMKVFMDEDRGVITVSFIVMLMDGTRDGLRPAIGIVQDKTGTTDNSYIILRDGHNDDTWNMTFYVAPAGFIDNNGNNENNGTTNTFPSSKPDTKYAVTPTGNDNGVCYIPISSTTTISSGTIFYIWLSTSAADVQSASTSGPYAVKTTNSSGTLTIDPDYIYSDAAATTKTSIKGGDYYITYQSADGTYTGKTDRAVTLSSTSSGGTKSSGGGGGGGGGCAAYSAGILLIAALVPYLLKKSAKCVK